MAIPIREYVQVNDQLLLAREEWKLEGNLHRVDGPAKQRWQVVDTPVDGLPVLISEEWYLEGMRHRVAGPAWQQWTIVDGVTAVLFLEIWYLEGRCHRVDGPAYRIWSIVDNLPEPTHEIWSIHGKTTPLLKLTAASNTIKRWYRPLYLRRWLYIKRHLQASGLLLWPGLLDLIRSY